eukprot:EG_transcript_297
MPSASYCGPGGPLFPSSDVSTLLDSECFVHGFLTCLPFAAAALTLLISALGHAVGRRRPRYVTVQGDEGAEPEGERDDPTGPSMDSGLEVSVVAQAAFQLHWVLAFVLVGCRLVDLAGLVVVERFEWFQLVAPLVQMGGVACCLLLYVVAGEHPPRPGPLVVTCLVWLLNALTSGAVLRWHLQQHSGLQLAVVVAAVALSSSALLALSDATLLGLLAAGAGEYQPVPAEDPDADGGTEVAPSPAVARSYADPQLVYRHDHAHWLSRISYTYVSELLSEAYRKPIVMERLGKLPLFDSCATHLAAVQGRFQRQRAMQRGLLRDVSLQGPLWKQYAQPMIVGYVLKQTADLLGFVGPIALKGIVEFIVERQEGRYAPPAEVTVAGLMRNGWVLAGLMFLAPFLQSTLLQAYYYVAIRASANVQSALMSMIYNKALTINVETLPADITVGSILSNMSSDVTTIMILFQFVHYIITVPIQMGITIYLLYWNIGWAGPASLLVMVVLLPIQMVLAQLIAKYQKLVLAENDGRLKLINELMQGIKIIKFYAWEATFMEKITTKRAKQLRLLLTRKLIGAAMVCLAIATPSLLTVTGFGLFTLWSPTPLTAGVAFSALSLFNVLLMPMFVLPGAVSAIINTAVSGKRILKFLLMPTMDRSFVHHERSAAHPVAIDVAGTFRWTLNGATEAAAAIVVEPPSPDPTTDVLSPTVAVDPLEQPRPEKFEFNIQVPRGSLLMIVGPVGSGKSTLVKTMLGDVPCEAGSVHLRGRVAYVPQQANIFNATVESNILFGKAMDRAWYDRVLTASGLQQDLAILPSGDQTEIGEKGINLSGGQKQRVSIARALYSDADIIVFDDPLSALDAHVGEHVFQEAVQKLLLGANKTVVMVTHQWQYLRYAQQVLLMKNTAIQARGTMDELNAAGFDLKHETYVPEETTQDTADDFLPDPSNLTARDRSLSTGSALLGRSASAVRARSLSSNARHASHRPQEEKAAADAVSGKLIQEEDRQVGAVGGHVYATYFRACGMGWVVTLVVVQVGAKAISVYSSVFLSHWASEANQPHPPHPVGYYLGVYTTIVMTSTIITGLGIAFASAAALRASRQLHSAMLDCVVRCPMAFFDTTPVGRIINRFSTDVTSLDMNLSEQLNQSSQMVLNLITCLATLVVINPWLGLLLAPVAGVYWFIQKFFRCTSRELQRLNNISKSPIFAHLSETLGGITTIRTYDAVPRFAMKAMEHVDRNMTAYLTMISANRWLGIRLDWLGAVIVSSTALACIWRADSMAPGLAGLSLTYALSFVGFASFTIRAVADTEMQMNSVERIAHYTTLETEMPSITPSPAETVPAGWPHSGEIIIRNLDAAYRPGLPLVLKGLTLKIRGGERIGVCGRTGSGKTSLLLALFRLLRIEGGHIAIDGVDIGTLPLPLLRARMAVIPQDPVLFAGTVRYNLDPTGQAPDQKLWDALRVAQLGDAVQSLEDEVLDGGENFSTGQRQLFCLARAFLKHTRILCLDEATASVDQETDRVIQDLIRTLFTHCTIVTIAHRISTILDYNRVLVLGDGKILEFDSPGSLLQKDSVFKSLVEAASKGTE